MHFYAVSSYSVIGYFCGLPKVVSDVVSDSTAVLFFNLDGHLKHSCLCSGAKAPCELFNGAIEIFLPTYLLSTCHYITIDVRAVFRSSQ